MVKEALLVRRGSPIGFYRKLEPICYQCQRILDSHKYICNARKDDQQYSEPCTELEWEICPLNPERSIIAKEKKKL